MAAVKPTLFEGEAGSGKTFSLSTTLASQIQATPLGNGQKVLALTFMHGSRRRLHSRLQLVPGLHQRFTCCTIDSLAWQITRRWRSLGRAAVGAVPDESAGYDATCEVAVEILKSAEVGRWIARTYPIVVVDEMQDIRADRLAMVQEIARFATVLAAADEFQDLNGGEDENEAVAWMHGNATIHRLGANRRTTSSALLTATSALRSGRDVVSGGDFRVHAMPSHHVAAAYAALQLATKGTRDIVFVVPTGPLTAGFVRDTIEKLTKGPIYVKRLKRNVGPFSVMWETRIDEEEAKIASAIGLPNVAHAMINFSDLRFDGHIAGVSSLWDALRKRRSLTGETACSVSDVQVQIKKCVHHSRSYRTRDDTRLRAMTVHQAKNREFRGVIILWPYQVFGSADKQRRLLYNAATRAREWALVLVQDSTGKRVAGPPFTSCIRPASVAAARVRAPRARK